MGWIWVCWWVGYNIMCQWWVWWVHLSSAVSFSNSCKNAVRLLTLIMFFPCLSSVCHIRFAVKVKEHSNPDPNKGSKAQGISRTVTRPVTSSGSIYRIYSTIASWIYYPQSSPRKPECNADNGSVSPNHHPAHHQNLKLPAVVCPRSSSPPPSPHTPQMAMSEQRKKKRWKNVCFRGLNFTETLKVAYFLHSWL